MILDKLETTVSYRCPHCGSGVVSLVGAFSLSADMLRLRCTCGNSEATIVYRRDKKLSITVPCMFCSSPHVFTMSQQMFFGRELYSFPCSYTGIEICFIGNRKKVLEALKQSDKELLELLGDATPDDIRAPSASLTDPQIFDIVMFVIKELDAEGKIKCRCEGRGEYALDILDDSVRIMCKRCGASVEVPTNSVISANAFLHADSLTLT